MLYLIEKQKVEFTSQIALGLRPCKLELNQDSPPVRIDTLQIPIPVKNKTRSKAPIALIDFKINNEIMDDDVPFPVHLKFGHIGGFDNGLLHTGNASLFTRIMDELSNTW